VVLRAIDAKQSPLDLADPAQVAAIGATHGRWPRSAAQAAEARAQQHLATDEARVTVERVRDLVEGVLDQAERRDTGRVGAPADLVHQRAPGTHALVRRRDRDRAGPAGAAPRVEEAAAGDLVAHRDHDAAAGVEVAVGVGDHRADGDVRHDRPETATLVDVVERVAKDVGDTRHVARGHVADAELARLACSPQSHASPYHDRPADVDHRSVPLPDRARSGGNPDRTSVDA